MQAKITTHKFGKLAAVLVLLILALGFTSAGAQTRGLVANIFPNTVTIFDADTDVVLGSVYLPAADLVGDCAVSPDGSLGFVTGFNSNVYVIDMATFSLAAGTNPIPISNEGGDIAVSPDGKYLLVSAGNDGSIAPLSVIDIATRTEINTLRVGQNHISVDVCADGSVLTSSTDGYVRRLTIDGAGNLTDTGEALLSVLPGTNFPVNVYCIPGGDHGIVLNFYPGTNGNLISYTLPGLTLAESRSLSGFAAYCGVVNAAGDRVYVYSTFPGSVDMFGYNAATGELSVTPLGTISSLPEIVNFRGMEQIALSPDQSKLYVNELNSLGVYDASTLAFITSITDASISIVTGIAFGPAIQPRQSEHNFTILAAEEVTLQKDAYVEGEVHSNGDAEYKRRSMQIGNAAVYNEIEIHRQSMIDGDATAPVFDYKGGACASNITGTATVDAVDMIDLPAITAFSTGSEAVEVKKDETGDIGPGAYAGVKVRDDATLNLAHDGSSGDYFFASLELGKRATMNVDASLGEVNIYVDGKLSFIRHAVFNAFDGANPSEKVTIWSSDDGSIKIRDDVVFNGCNLIAPDAEVRFQKRSFFKGAVCARAVDVQKTAVVVNHQSQMTPAEASARAWAIYKEDLNAGEGSSVLPDGYELSQNFPNPFNPTTTIRFALPEDATVSLRIYNIHGQLVRTLANGSFSAGSHNFTWDGTDENGLKVVSGMYFYQLQSRDYQEVKKMLMLK